MKRLHLLTLAAGSLAASAIAHASLLGASVDITANYPNSGVTFTDYGTFTVPSSGSLNVDAGFSLQPTQITLTDYQQEYFYPASFDGLEFTDVSGDPGITGVTVDGASTITGESVSFTSNQVLVNLSGQTISPGQSLVLDLEFAPPATGSSVTPEPSSIALLGTGLLGVAGVVRRRVSRA